MPRWSPDGRDLYYWRPAMAGTPDSLFRVRIDRTPGVRVNTPQLVLARDLITNEGWDLHPDGKRFIALEAVTAQGGGGPAATVSRYLIIPNWFTELKARTATAKK